MKAIIAALLLVFSLSLIIVEAANPPAPADSSKAAVTLYYFHRTQRCSGCRNAEARTFEAAREVFAVQIEKGILLLKTVAVDGTDEEKKLALDYGAFGPSVFISLTKDGKPVRVALDQMWPKLQEGTEAYKAYVVENLKKYL